MDFNTYFIYDFSMIKCYNCKQDLKQKMLKSLLTKIKSQQSQTHSSTNHHQHPIQQNNQSAFQQSILYQQLPQNIEIDSPIQKIRYYAFQSSPNIYNKILSCPISNFSILPYAKRKVKQIDLTKFPLPSYIFPLNQILNKQLPTYNHLLINIYSPGIGIMPHFDGSLYKSKVVVLSLGGPGIINFTDYNNINKNCKILLEDQSLHIFQEDAYQKYLHGIQEFTVDSIFIKVQGEGQGVKVVRSSVSNFHLTRLSKIIMKILKNLHKASSQFEIDLSKQTNCLSYLISIKQNEQYNYKIQLVRQQRISITIRQKFIDHTITN